MQSLWLFLLLSWLPALSLGVTVGQHELFEHVIPHDESSYYNVWNQIEIDVTMTAPSGKTVFIGGFYYDTDEWRFRFAPDELGTWTWTYDIRKILSTSTHASIQSTVLNTANGSFDCGPSGNPGFLKASPTNNFRWVLGDSGRAFHPFGAQDCMLAADPAANFSINGPTRVPFPQYVEEHAKWANIWRLNINNCSFKVVQWFLTNSPPNGNRYIAENLRALDEFAHILRSKGLRIYFVMFAWDFEFGNDPEDPAKMYAIRHFLSHLVNRYGAMVDIFEVGNEVRAEPNPPEWPGYNDTWLINAAEHIRSIDPYNHPISQSYERPDLTQIEINSPHLYVTKSLSETPSYFTAVFDEKKVHGKPVIYGEMGNTGCNNATNTPYRWRVTSWIAFFKEVSIVFWNTPGFQYCHGAANVDIDQEFRDNMVAHSNFIKDFDPNAVMANVSISPGVGLEGWALDGPRDFGLYIFSPTNPFGNITGEVVTIETTTGGRGEWIRPLDGAVLGTVDVPSGEIILDVPEFSGDIALKIRRSLYHNPTSVSILFDDGTIGGMTEHWTGTTGYSVSSAGRLVFEDNEFFTVSNENYEDSLTVLQVTNPASNGWSSITVAFHAPQDDTSLKASPRVTIVQTSSGVYKARLYAPQSWSPLVTTNIPNLVPGQPFVFRVSVQADTIVVYTNTDPTALFPPAVLKYRGPEINELSAGKVRLHASYENSPAPQDPKTEVDYILVRSSPDDTIDLSSDADGTLWFSWAADGGLGSELIANANSWYISLDGQNIPGNQLVNASGVFLEAMMSADVFILGIPSPTSWVSPGSEMIMHWGDEAEGEFI